MSHQQGKPGSAKRTHGDRHGDAVTIASADVGSVSVCACGVITLTLQYISLRLEPGAFRELQGLLQFSHRKLDGGAAHAAPHGAGGADVASVH